MFILFDTNVWFSQLGLQSPIGAAIRHFARRRNATVAIPEIVQLEVEETLTTHMLKLKNQIEDSHRQLLPVLGKLESIHLPSEEEIRKAVKSIIPNLDVSIRRIPFNIDAARSSMMKALRKIPPSRKNNEQFRDGVIWAHCLELLSEGDVYLVSEDKDFYYEKKYKKGLAPELIKEMQDQSKTREVKLIPNLTELLNEIRIPIQLDDKELFDSIMVQQREIVEEILHSNGFELRGRVKGEVNCFVTEEAQKISFTFSFIHPCQDSTGTGRRPGELKLEGSGFLNPETKETNEVQLSNTLLEYPDWESGGPSRGAVFLSGHINAPEVHQIRFPLDPPQMENEDRS